MGVEDVESKILAYCNGIIFTVNILPFKKEKRGKIQKVCRSYQHYDITAAQNDSYQM